MDTTRQSSGFGKSTELLAEQVTSEDRPYCIAAYSLAADANYAVLRFDTDGAHPMTYERIENAQRRMAEVTRDVPSAFVYERRQTAGEPHGPISA